VQAFGVQDDEEVCRIILEQGELQVSEGERKAQVEKYVAHGKQADLRVGCINL
jgi:ribosome maturation protein Sdo1